MSLNNLFQILKGGSGSGNFGHSGIPGHVGGSTSGSLGRITTVDNLRDELPVDPDTGSRGTKDIGSIDVVGYRVGSTIDKFNRGVYYSSDQKGAEAYSSLHPGSKVQRYDIKLNNALLAGHQNDVSMKFFNKTYNQMNTGGVEGGRKFDVKIRNAAKKAGYDGIVYVSPAPPAKGEIAVFK